MKASLKHAAHQSAEPPASGTSSLVSAVRCQLASSSHRDIRALQCDDVGGAVQISGQVKSYYLKQLAQESVRDVEGVSRVVNLVEVA